MREENEIVAGQKGNQSEVLSRNRARGKDSMEAPRWIDMFLEMSIPYRSDRIHPLWSTLNRFGTGVLGRERRLAAGWNHIQEDRVKDQALKQGFHPILRFQSMLSFAKRARGGMHGTDAEVGC